MFQVRAFEARTITWWYQRRADIDFDPPFQRSGKLWSPVDKAFLIDSILNEYDFPKIYLADFSYMGSSLNTKGKKFAVIDGRQRLETIFGFIENEFALSDRFILEANSGLDIQGLRYSDLRHQYPEVALIFEQFNLPVMSVITDDEARINQLFVRMNRNKPLTGAEIRNAMAGVVPAAIRRLAAHPFFVQHCAFPKNRGQDKNVAAKLLLLTQSNEFVNTKKSDLDSFVVSFEASGAQASTIQAAEERATRVLDDMTNEFDRNDPRLRSSGLIPVYFRVVEQHGPENFGAFLSFWNTFASAPLNAIQRTNVIEDQTKARIALYSLIKRNPNDSYALQRLFAIVSFELQRYRLGLYKDAIASLNRFRTLTRSVKAEEKAKQSGGRSVPA